MGTISKNIGVNIKRLRLAKGWTQEVLATHLKASQPMVAHLEKGGATLEHVEKLSAIFNVAEEEIVIGPAAKLRLVQSQTLDLSHIPLDVLQLVADLEPVRIPQLRGYLDALGAVAPRRIDDES
jgi:transcriptional regulator with XRE-family HTH domain